MGIHYWSKSAVLTLLVVLSIGHAHAATRKYVSMPSDSSVVNSGRGSSKSGSTLSIPADPLEGEYIPSSYPGGSKGSKLPVNVTYDYSIPRTLKGMSNTIKGGIVGVGLSIGLEYMLDQVGGFIDDAGNAVKPSEDSIPYTNPDYYHWYHGGTRSATAEQACKASWQLMSSYTNGYTFKSVAINGTEGSCIGTHNVTGAPSNLFNVTRLGGSCPQGTSLDQATGTCRGPSAPVPLTDADYDLMEAAASVKDSEWLKDRLREHCEGGLNPQACYESLRDSTSLSGPSSVTEPGPTTTTVGPTGTTTTTNNTKVDITYGDNYYDYRKTSTTVKTNPDGTTETTTETQPETEQPQEEEQQEINFTDSEFPPVEPFYVQKYPDGLQGVWQDAQSRFDDSQFMSFLNSFIPQFSGSCPSWSLSFNIATWASFGNQSFVNLCYVFDFIKVILLVTALFTARAITFGG
ncbi:hypothetical protein GFL09_01275 [Pseudomonas stutzeri]|uniref:hypothetical protein n=1 Tax=Stutzerimonas stutzeri TaxID=316 RepID=UPI0019094A20|nr:hypothetical protein [Stutzerimonas stutzeri]MBK3866340.1 hypothetical protein [Stutzerimonas stutzeri]